MAHNNREIEIQLKVESTKKLVDFLKENGTFVSESHQVDEYFNPCGKDFLAKKPINEWLRLRDSNDKFSINYKNWYYNDNGASSHCDEYESPISDIESLRKIFKALDYKIICKVDKVRRSWNYKDFEVSLDSIKGLGDFVEVEYIGTDDNADPNTVAKEMTKFLKEVGCGKLLRNYVGYPFMLMFPDKVKFEEV